MNNIKLVVSDDVILKEKNFRFYKSKDSIINLSINQKKLKLFANENQEFLNLNSIKTNRVLIPIVKSFKYHNSKIYVFEIQMLYKTKTAEIKKSLINLIDEICESFKISKCDRQNIYKLVVKFTNFTKFEEIEFYLEDERIAS